jgi:hypothetical protein
MVYISSATVMLCILQGRYPNEALHPGIELSSQDVCYLGQCDLPRR